MRVFVTGATGFIGTEIVRELLRGGHIVTGLSRTTSGAEKLKKAGATAVIGQLTDLALLTSEASKSDGVIHAGFIHGFQHMNFSNRLKLMLGALTGGVFDSFRKVMLGTELDAVHALGRGLEGSGKPLIVTSGVLFLPQGRISTENDSHVATAPNRSFSEKAAFDFVAKGVRSSVLRLPPTVHSEGDGGFIPMIIKSAKKKGTSVYIKDGANKWPAVHRLDAARLYRAILENGKAGAVYHGVGETGIPFREIANLIGSKLNIPVKSVSDEGAKHLGFLSSFVGVDNPSSSEWTQHQLNWQPKEAGLLTDMTNCYF